MPAVSFQKTILKRQARQRLVIAAEIGSSVGDTGDEAERSKAVERITKQMPPWAHSLMQPCRYKGRWGGRGGAKSFAFADAFLALGIERPCRIVCAREFLASIRDSVHSLLKQRISDLEIGQYYDVQRDRIYGNNGTEFLFKGLHHNVENLKSIPGITHLWIEEAQSTSAESWETVKPTVRDAGSEIWVSFNPKLESDVIYQQFVVDPIPGADICKVGWADNPYFSKVLDDERRELQRRDPDAYAHVWEGELWAKSDAQILNGKWHVDEFEIAANWDGPYLGADFGFANDPTALIMCWIADGKLMVSHESYAHQLEIDDTAARWRSDVPGCEKYTIRADNARPESISYLRRHGIPRITACAKGKGSVEDGIAHLRSYNKIVIHPRCRNYAQECLMWSYKIDKYSGDILPVPAGGWDHLQDALRYSQEPILKAKQARWIKHA